MSVGFTVSTSAFLSFVSFLSVFCPKCVCVCGGGGVYVVGKENRLGFLFPILFIEGRVDTKKLYSILRI
jgi:hypothetical protein